MNSTKLFQRMAAIALLALMITACLPTVPAATQEVPTEPQTAVTSTQVVPTAAPIQATATQPVVEPASSATPAEQQPQGTPYSFEGVSFEYDPTMIFRAVGHRVAENPGTTDGPYWETAPEHIRIDLEGYSVYADKTTALSPQIFVWPVEDFRKMSSPADETIGKLQTLLADKPSSAEQIPFLPIWNASQSFLSNVKYHDFQNGSGVRFLTIYAQYPAPINNHDLFYTYQGLTADGRYVVSIILPVLHPSLAENPQAFDMSQLQAIAEDYRNYRTEQANALSALPNDTFVPNLDKLDALVASLKIE
jgi:hypothetical protein